MLEDETQIRDFLMGPGADIGSEAYPDLEEPFQDEEDSPLNGPTFPGGCWTRESYQAQLRWEADGPKWKQFLEDLATIRKSRRKLFASGEDLLVEMLDMWVHTQAEAFSDPSDTFVQNQDPATQFTSFTATEAERCPGPWVAICNSPACMFAIGMSASGLSEAKRVALEEHKNQQRHPGICGRTNPMLFVGRVPDE